MLYSSVDHEIDASLQMDSNSYLAFKSVDSAIVGKIMEHLNDVSDQLEEGMIFPFWHISVLQLDL